MPKIIFDHTKNGKLYINLPVHHEIIFEYKLVLEVLSFNTSNNWYKNSGHFLMPNFCSMHRTPNKFKNQFFPIENIFFPIFNKFLLKNLNPHSLCEVWNMNNLILCKLHILFSIVKLKLGHNFCQFIHRFKSRIFWVLVISCIHRFF